MVGQQSFFVQLLFSGGSDCKVLAWSPKKPAVTEVASSNTSRSALQHYSTASNVYQDSWSDDET